jgi:hypothetical protein
MKVIAGLMMAGVLVGVAAPAMAGSAPAPSPTPLGDTISLEFSPEFFGINADAGSAPAHSTGQYSDSYVKVGFAHSLGNGWGMGFSIQETVKDPNTIAPGKAISNFQPEASLGYKWKADALTFGITGALGYTSSAIVVPNSSGAYYAVSGTVDWKLDSKWTWNVINARYRNAFAGSWFTPKLATGVTYQIDPRQAVYASFGYAWVDKGSYWSGTHDGTPFSGLEPDKYNVAVGYKIGF